MMTLANYGIGSSKHKDTNSSKVLSKSLQIRNRAELQLKQCMKNIHKLSGSKRAEVFDAITDYYSRIPFNVVIWNKYQTKQCIIDSILLLDSNFNPYKAREAFRIIETMLTNLVQFPWHKEFRKIHTYSGQFIMSVTEPLIEAEEVFKAAGFEASRECPLHLVLPENKMPQVDDGESVMSVIFDCMVAQVILSNIIDIYENCCKTQRRKDAQGQDVNCYSWIQAYFRERSHQTTERACSNIQELLNSITNLISKLEVSQGSSKYSQQNSDRFMSAGTGLKSDLLQKKTRNFLEQLPRNEDDIITISNDLLKIPYISNESPDDSRYNYNASNSHQQQNSARINVQPSSSSSYNVDHQHYSTVDSSNQPPRYGLSSSFNKYSNTPYNDYETMREFAPKSTSSGRTFWSCGSCTYKNRLHSDLCEMCHNKRPVHR